MDRLENDATTPDIVKHENTSRRSTALLIAANEVYLLLFNMSIPFIYFEKGRFIAIKS